MNHDRDFTIQQQIRYRIDNALARGVWVVMIWLTVALLLCITTVGFATWAWGIGPRDQPVNLPEAVWLALTRSLDPGTFGVDEGPRFRIAGLVITLVGVLAVAAVIGLVSSAIDRRLDILRRGKSLVLEDGHTLILGASGKLSIVISELIEANRSKSRHPIVVLATEDKIALDELLQREIPERGTSKLVVRRGEPASLSDLRRVRPERAKAIIILRTEGPSGDAEVVKVAVAAVALRAGLPEIPIIAELEDPGTARALRQAMPGRVTTIVTKEAVARIAAQTARASGLGSVYQEILDFSGSEFYLKEVPESWVGRNFGEALTGSPDAMLVGILNRAGAAVLCPDFGQVIEADQRLVFIAEDDEALTLDDGLSDWSPTEQRSAVRGDDRIERTLLIGWNHVADRIAEEIDRHVAVGSTLNVLVNSEVEATECRESLEGLRNQELSVAVGNTVDRDDLIAQLAPARFDHVVILCTHSGMTPIESDARALLALMHVRNYLSEQEREFGVRKTNLVTEVMESQSVELAAIGRPDDFIVSQRLVSLMIAQLSENPSLKPVIQDVLDSHGAQIMMHAVEGYVEPGRTSCLALVEAVRSQGAVLIGWRVAEGRGRAEYLEGGIRVNPAKSEWVELSAEDSLIVLVRH